MIINPGYETQDSQEQSSRAFRIANKTVILGRWISRDPFGEFGGLNLYDYVFNNPISGIDPMGLCGWRTLGGWSNFAYGWINPLAVYNAIALNLINQGLEDIGIDPNALALFLPLMSAEVELGQFSIASDTELTAAGNDVVTLYHQGNLENGVSASRSLSTSPSPDLSQYDPNGMLYQFNVPRTTLNGWFDTGAAESLTDYHAPSGITTPEIRIWPPTSSQMNQFLVPNSP